MANFSALEFPKPYNEVLRHYPPGSEDAKLLDAAVKRMQATVADVPLVIGGKEIHTAKKGEQRCPGDHSKVLATYSIAGPEHVEAAIKAAGAAKEAWEALPPAQRLGIWLRAADLLTVRYRYDVLAATMLGQGKTVWQAEIDSACETADFLRFNPVYAAELYGVQPRCHTQGVWNREEYRPLEGFVWALTPFNFTAIGANLPSSPAMMGNVVLWKPSSTAVLSNWLMMKIFIEAGMPDGVINFLPGPGAMMSDVILKSPEFSGIHFTGSTAVFENINKRIAENAAIYKSYPRIVGETGGKDFHFIHESADVINAVNQTIRSSFEYQGQKCSACSRAYVPDTMWPEFRKVMETQMKRIKMSAPEDFSAYVSAVIDSASFKNIKKYIDDAQAAPNTKAEVIIGGKCDDSKGWFVEPTVILCHDPMYTTMQEEIFGPVLSIHVYDATKLEDALTLCDKTSTYGLTGAIFGRSAKFIAEASWALRHAAGNFYINDKCTGAVVGQQPFGGARKSGTNDKAGEKWNLIRWVSVRSIKETFVGISDFGYPHMGAY